MVRKVPITRDDASIFGLRNVKFKYTGRLCGLVVTVRFPALPDPLRSSGSGTGSTQPREYI
jgi:hypothetical protein